MQAIEDYKCSDHDDDDVIVLLEYLGVYSLVEQEEGKYTKMTNHDHIYPTKLSKFALLLCCVWLCRWHVYLYGFICAMLQ